MGFKEDADFARYVSMGAVGTAAVATHLREAHGHRPIELERYAMSNKIWQTKVKRLRLPDLVCVRCGRRIESRAKSKLGIILSHSESAGRGWDAGGMRDDDLYAFLRADLGVFPPYAGTPAFFTASGLRAALPHARRSSRKAISEGAEVTLTWPCWVSSSSGTFVGLDDQGRIVCRLPDGRRTTYWQWRNWPTPRFVYLEQGDDITGQETIVAGVVMPPSTLACPGNSWDLREALTTGDASERYGEMKAVGVLGRADLLRELAESAEDPQEDWRMRLEALASLARLEPQSWTNPILVLAATDHDLPEQRMEAAFVLSEIPTEEAARALTMVAESSKSFPELRAAAVWGLGQGAAPRPERVLPLTVDPDRLVALHAITAIEVLPDDLATMLVEWLGDEDPRPAVAAQLLQRHLKVEALLDACELGGAPRLWAVRALGDLSPAFVRARAGSRLSDELLQLLQPMWHGQQDWLRGGESKDGLEALDIQKVRLDPSNPAWPPGSILRDARPSP